MKIVVCVSNVPDTAAKINIGADGKSIDTKDVTYVLNPYDEFAVEEALKVKEAAGGEVVVLGYGTDKTKETIRKALAMGADSAVLLKTESYLDPVAEAKAYANEIKELGAELVFTGKQSVDYDDGVTGQLLAEFLGYNCVSVVVGLTVDGESITAEREIEGGKEIVATKLPAVITAQKGLNEPRYASLKGIMQAKRKKIEEKELADSQNYLEVVKMKKPAAKSPGKILGSDVSAVPELVKLLKEEAKVI